MSYTRLLVLALALTTIQAGLIDAIGRDVGLTRSQEVDAQQGARMLKDANDGRPDNLYFAALLHLYGKGGVAESPKQAIAHFRRAAEQGHAGAMVALGTLTRAGHGISTDEKAALAWFKEAARRGHVDGMWLLGQALLQGSGIAADFHQAKDWLAQAANQQSYDALHWLGVMHEYGLGVQLDTRKAREFYDVAAKNGHALAEYHLALMHAYGDRAGTPQDLPRALTLFQKGAARNHGGSSFNLGRMAMYGQGTPVDYDVARYWFSRAVAANDPAVGDAARTALLELEAGIKEASEVEDDLFEEFDRRNLPPESAYAWID